MRRNIGQLDSILRSIVGMALILFALGLGFPETGWNWIGWIGIIPLATAAVGNCPLYTILGFSTRRKHRAHG
ncbi:MAG TPA: DUF2892 domain-containing protein [Rhizomicrobium sp.]|nr:DUF2892 domain-containing protein [Rhizomicrobium sp.]